MISKIETGSLDSFTQSLLSLFEPGEAGEAAQQSLLDLINHLPHQRKVEFVRSLGEAYGVEKLPKVLNKRALEDIAQKIADYSEGGIGHIENMLWSTIQNPDPAPVNNLLTHCRRTGLRRLMSALDSAEIAQGSVDIVNDALTLRQEYERIPFAARKLFWKKLSIPREVEVGIRSKDRGKVKIAWENVVRHLSGVLHNSVPDTSETNIESQREYTLDEYVHLISDMSVNIEKILDAVVKKPELRQKIATELYERNLLQEGGFVPFIQKAYKRAREGTLSDAEIAHVNQALQDPEQNDKRKTWSIIVKILRFNFSVPKKRSA